MKIIIDYCPDDQIYIADCADYPGCLAHGRTVVEAVVQFAEALEGWLIVDKARQAGRLAELGTWDNLDKQRLLDAGIEDLKAGRVAPFRR